MKITEFFTDTYKVIKWNGRAWNLIYIPILLVVGVVHSIQGNMGWVFFSIVGIVGISSLEVFRSLLRFEQMRADQWRERAVFLAPGLDDHEYMMDYDTPGETRNVIFKLSEY